MDDTIYFIIAIAIVIILFAVLSITLWLIMRRKYDGNFPARSVYAVVVSKHTGTEDVPNNERYALNFYPPRYTRTIPAYYITFEENGMHHSFEVGEREYLRLNEGDGGKLTFQGKHFKRFEIN